MGHMQFFRRYAPPICVIASICSVDGSFAQTPIPYDGKPTIIGRWKLITINGSKTEGRSEEIAIDEDSLRVLEDCNSTSYTYVVNDGKMIAKPDMTTLVYCDGDRTQEEEIAVRNQHAIVSAIVHAKVQLNGNILKLQPNSFNGELVFHRLDWFAIGRWPGP